MTALQSAVASKIVNEPVSNVSLKVAEVLPLGILLYNMHCK